jgi:hypothetical protein
MIYKDEDGKYTSFAWPGGYPVYHICDDSGVLCPTCANDPNNPVHEDKPDDGWRIIGSDINWEDAELSCNQCIRRIESAYSEENAE